MNEVKSLTQSPGSRRPRWLAHDGVAFGAVSLVHLVAAVLYKELAGITIVPGASFDWGQSWHLMPVDLLRGRLAETLWNLHAQPPLYNLWCGIFIKLFHPNHIASMHYPQIVLGALASGMVYVILRGVTGRRLPAFLIALVLGLNPSLFLFEAGLGYDLLTAFWLVLSVFLVALFRTQGRPVFIYGMILSLNLLILTRSMFHPVLLLAVIPFACLIAGPHWRKTLAAALIISLLSVGWYAKNCARFGFFGGSSWGGQNLWTNVSANYDREDLEGFIDAGVIDDTVLAVLVWNRPEAYRPYGFDRGSDIEALSRNNYNNVNIIRISRMYQRNAVRLILHRPLHYAVNVAKAYRIFCLPTSRTKYLGANAERLGPHEWVWSQIIQGQFLTGSLGRWVGKDPFFSIWFFLLPASLATLVWLTIRRCGRSGAAWLEYARSDAVLFLIAILVVYTVAVACTFDYGENGRFKFAIEPVLWVFVIGVAYRLRDIRRKQNRDCPCSCESMVEPPSPPPTRLSIVIPTWNRKDLLAECLDSLAGQTYQDFETVVVDDGSTDGTAGMVAEAYPMVQLVCLAENSGFCRAANAGIRAAAGELVMLLNNDMTLEPDCLERIVAAAQASQADLFAPLVLWRDDPRVIYSAGDLQRVDGRPEAIGFRCIADGFVYPAAIFGVSGGAGVYRRVVFERVGLLDERFVAYFEDSDLSFRARLAGFSAELVQHAVCHHVGSASIEGRTWWRARQCCRNHALLVLKNIPARLLVRYAPAILAERVHQVRQAFSAARAEFGAARAGVELLKVWLSIARQAPHALAERRRIQRTMTIEVEELAGLLTEADKKRG